MSVGIGYWWSPFTLALKRFICFLHLKIASRNICEYWLLVAALHTSLQNVHLLSPCENCKLKHMSVGIGYWWSPFTLATIRQSEAWGEGRVGAFGLSPLTSLAPTSSTSTH